MLQKGSSLTYLTAIYAASSISSKVISFAVFFVLTHYLSKDEIGQYDVILNAVTLIVPLISFQLGNSALRWLLGHTDRRAQEVVLRNICFGVLLGIFLYSFAFVVAFRLFRFQFALHLYCFSLLQMIFSVSQQCLRGLRLNKEFATSGILYSFFLLIFSLFGLTFHESTVETIVIANICSLLLSIIYMLFSSDGYAFLRPRLDVKLIKKFLKYSLPLLPNSLSWWLVTSASRFIILFYLGLEANGEFAIAYRVSTIVMLLTDTFYLAWQEKLIESDRRDQGASEKVLLEYVNLLFSLLVLVLALSKPLLKVLVDTAFFNAWRYLPLLLLSVAAQSFSSFYGAAYLREKKTSDIFVSSFVGGAVTVISGFILTPILHLQGTALSIAAGFSVMLILRIKQAQSFFPVKFPLLVVGAYLVIIVLVSAANLLESTSLSVSLIICSIALCATSAKNVIRAFKF